MHETLASPKLVTAEELFRMPDDGFRYELVRGELRQSMPPGGEHGVLAVDVAVALKLHVKQHALGIVLAETGFKLAFDPDVVRAPDVSFIAQARVPAGGIPRGYIPFAPDLAVEILSPDNTYAEMEEKLENYFTAGARAVWIVNPKRRTVTIHRAAHAPLTLHHTDTLDGGDLLPGFRLPLTELFPG